MQGTKGCEVESKVLMSLAKDDSKSLRLRCPWEFSLDGKLEMLTPGVSKQEEMLTPGVRKQEASVLYLLTPG